MGAQEMALTGLCLLSRFHGVPADPAQITLEYGATTALDERMLLLAAKHLGLKAKITNVLAAKIASSPLPVMAFDRNGLPFLIGVALDAGKTLVVQQLDGRTPEKIPFEVFEERYAGRIFMVASRASSAGGSGSFGISWFVPAVIKYRRLIGEIVVASLFVQLFALVTPLFFQVVMDKVLTHQAIGTLNVIAVGLLCVAIFEVAMSGLRTYVSVHTSSKIDVELGAKLFRHILALPLAYFESRRVGDTIARVRELENIRQFLTGQALTSVLDLLFTAVFLLVMMAYSLGLTLIVICSLPLYGALSAMMGRRLRRQLDEKFSRNADNNAFLVESISGMGTVKSLGLASQMIRSWDKLLAGYVSSGVRASTTAMLGQQGIQLIQKTVGVAILFFGAKLVIEGKLTLGQFVAFNMLAGQVVAPIIRLSQLWQDFQQVGISVRRLGDILNTHTEVPSAHVNMTRLEGRITFEHVDFRYLPDRPSVLHDLDFEVQPGEVVGIVGSSGSGKSTLTKLVQRLYSPERGRVLIDGQDLALADPSWLRRQLGVVLQDSFLFNRSIRENIAIAEPGMAIEPIIEAAKLAGCHDFIMALPQGYDMQVGEQGARLSGGQRQRLAIARALVRNPKILILDEATSALDYESEQAIMSNMREICRGRTVLIIAHRLSVLRGVDTIIVLENGRIEESGPPQRLLLDPNSSLSRLHALQKSGISA